MSKVILDIQNLHGGYGREPVLHGINLQVRQGEFIALIGPNGHGKSTILKAVSGLLPRCNDEIELFGLPTKGLSPWQVSRRGLVHIPQGDLLFGEMTIEENLIMGAYSRPRGEVSSAIEEVYLLFPKLRERRRQSISTLSGGERRMVGVGRGLMTGGELLMIDEPSLGLAPIVVEQIYAVLRQLIQSGKSLLLVEENPARIADLADHVHLIDDGRVAWSGVGAGLMENTELLQTYLGSESA